MFFTAVISFFSYLFPTALSPGFIKHQAIFEAKIAKTSQFSNIQSCLQIMRFFSLTCELYIAITDFGVKKSALTKDYSLLIAYLVLLSNKLKFFQNSYCYDLNPDVDSEKRNW